MSDVGAQWWKLVVVSPSGEWLEPRDVRGDLDCPDEFRDVLVQIAQATDSYRTGGSPVSWIGEWEARVYDEHEARKGCWRGGFGQPDKVLRFAA